MIDRGRSYRGVAPKRVQRWTALLIAIALVGPVATRARGQDAATSDRITIGKGDCRNGVRLVARGVPISEVLTRLATTLGFEFEIVGASDSRVDVDLVRPAVELITELSPLDNIIVLQARDPSCPGRDRVTKVWMLSKVKSSGALPFSTPVPSTAIPVPGAVAPIPNLPPPVVTPAPIAQPVPQPVVQPVPQPVVQPMPLPQPSEGVPEGQPPQELDGIPQNNSVSGTPVAS